ncbi:MULTISPECIES: hypothetical protein [Lysobacter]|uniref:Uncharacterized protein n=1 Tax=Lysobacter antibioticus TaxID=84531 RepID=A0A0S2F5X1_LYSAN|nr:MULTISPECIES: hypothetical protein [Lysobacter]ALN64799.1 hypothetical protein GLA29479_3948 [Lysobacter antibioticus]ALN78940.1 hypothetical protein LA76x_0779 [Lysobacter antibioticus]
MFRVELKQRDGSDDSALAVAIAEIAQEYRSAEAALRAVLPQARRYAAHAPKGLWLRIYDADSQPVFGTLVP